MTLGEKEFARLPGHLQRLFYRLPNHGSDEVVGLFPETVSGSGNKTPEGKTHGIFDGRTSVRVRADCGKDWNGDSGSAARFFYCAKASRADRGEGNSHPTVKPTKLMAYLCRLVTPPGGLVLDPFAGSGTTGEAAHREGFRAVLIEREPEYCRHIERRLQRLAGESADRSLQRPATDAGPLFATA